MLPSMREAPITPSDLLLDPNNFRFHDVEGFVAAADNRLHEQTVQQRAYVRLRDDISSLKKSIVANGYIPVERIIVRPYEHQAGKYLVIEGNRRVAAVKWILQDKDSGVDIAGDVLESINTLPCVIAEEAGSDEAFRACLMGIRHVSGISNWGGYQRAKLVALLRDDLEKTPADIAERLGMTVHEVNRRYRAFKALGQMSQDEEYGEHSKPDMYPLFHEAVSLPAVREWLAWNDTEYRFDNAVECAKFYELICSKVEEEGGREIAAKIKSREELRKLADILPKAEAKMVLLDPSKSFQDAVTIASQDQIARAWAGAVSAAISALESMGVAELKRLSTEDIALLARLSEKARERINDYNQLISQRS